MQPLNLPNEGEPGRLAPALRLLACLAVLAACWLVALPMAGRTPTVRDMIERNERLGIDPSAKFYTELPAMPRIRQQMAAVWSESGDAFWRAGIGAE